MANAKEEQRKVAQQPTSYNQLNNRNRTAVFITNENNVRSTPDVNARLIAVPQKGTKCEVLDQDGKWYKVKFKPQYSSEIVGWTNRINIKFQ